MYPPNMPMRRILPREMPEFSPREYACFNTEIFVGLMMPVVINGIRPVSGYFMAMWIICYAVWIFAQEHFISRWGRSQGRPMIPAQAWNARRSDAFDPFRNRQVIEYAFIFCAIEFIESVNQWHLDAQQWCLRIFGSAVLTLLLEGVIRAYSWSRQRHGAT